MKKNIAELYISETLREDVSVELENTKEERSAEPEYSKIMKKKRSAEPSPYYGYGYGYRRGYYGGYRGRYWG